jgi:hypothetical protein
MVRGRNVFKHTVWFFSLVRNTVDRQGIFWVIRGLHYQYYISTGHWTTQGGQKLLKDLMLIVACCVTVFTLFSILGIILHLIFLGIYFPFIHSSIEFLSLFLTCFFVFSVLRLELRAFTLSQSTTPTFVKGFSR